MISNILSQSNFSKDDLISLLSAEQNFSDAIRERAYSIMQQFCGEDVFLRGLIEFSNYCTFDCYYCGIRKSNHQIERYTLEKDEIVDSAIWCADNGYGSLVLQSGERNDDKFISFICDVVQTIKQQTKSDKLPDGLGITLCVGEQSLENYKRLRSSGAHRYLLRIETSNRDLYYTIHPEKQNYENRIEALYNLKDAGFQVGTGIMIGLPGQTIEHLADDIIFFRETDVDMIGMGPYIVHKQTPMGYLEDEYKQLKEIIYRLALRMIAVSRIYLRDVNIASTTALQAMYPLGREAGLRHGANIIMPLLTPTQVREKYTLYDGKPCIDEFSSDCYECIQRRIESTGRTVGKDQWGDSMHFKNKSQYKE